MKPILSITDYNRIKLVLQNLPYYERTKDVGLLLNELACAEVVAEEKLPPDAIRLGSFVVVEDLGRKRKMELTLVIPRFASLKEKKVSLLAPIGIALIGYRQGDTVEWSLPGGLKKLKILEVSRAGKVDAA